MFKFWSLKGEKERGEKKNIGPLNPHLVTSARGRGLQQWGRCALHGTCLFVCTSKANQPLKTWACIPVFGEQNPLYSTWLQLAVSGACTQLPAHEQESGQLLSHQELTLLKTNCHALVFPSPELPNSQWTGKLGNNCKRQDPAHANCLGREESSGASHLDIFPESSPAGWEAYKPSCFSLSLCFSLS